VTTASLRAAVQLGAASFLLFIGGCDADAPRASICLPPDAVALVSQTAAADTAPVSADVEAIFDISGSMAGYLKSSRSEVRPIPDLLALLPSIAQSRNDRMTFFSFGNKISPLSVGEADALVTPAAYVCRQKPCESHINDAFKHIAESTPGTLSILVTDLWLVNSELSESGEVAIGTQLRRLIESGRSIEIIGVGAPYVGPIYDLPNGLRYDKERERPLFVVLVGPLSMVEAYRGQLLKSPSRAFALERVHESLFTLSPWRSANLSLSVSTGDADRVFVSRQVLPPWFGQPFQQFAISGDAVRAAKAQELSAKVVVPLAQLALPGAVWEGKRTGRALLWMYNESGPEKIAGHCAEWVKFKELRNTWSLDTVVFKFNAKSEIAFMPPAHTFLLAAWIENGAVSTPNPANRWMRDWSFDISTVDRVLAQQPVLVPTLNLDQTATILETALNNAIMANHAAPQGVVAAIRLEN
jgi:hypothetical protein